MRHRMRKPCGLKVRCYDARMIGLNSYLDVFPEAKASENICETELNENVLNSIPKAYVQGFYC